ncbi:restriction endonuclease subunit S [Bacillus pinisoli]|uniref:restriction endonuclease subunit S n=1 Tax=Bacillus pinisoli TaxID=2901866 RepID=UPI001FF6E297|nr:restriction endonuclease subunit S [Bacillus pinisoli]
MSNKTKKQKTVTELLEEVMIPKEEHPYNLPANWCWVKFDASVISLSNRNKQLKQKEYKEAGRYPVVDQGQKRISGYTDNKDLVITEDLPVVIFGDHTRNIKWVDFDFVQGADGTKILKPKEFFYPKFLYYLLCVINLPDKGYSRHFKFLRESPLTLPPLNEQKRIADKVERLLNKIDEAKQLIDEARGTFELRREAILEKAFRGNLTAKWREDNTSIENANVLLENIIEKKRSSHIKINTNNIKNIEKSEMPFTLPNGWIWIKLGELAYYVTSGSRDWSKYYSDAGAYFIRTQDINTNKLVLDNVAYMELPEKVEGKRSLIEKNDLLTTITGANVGKCARVDFEISEAYVSQSVALTKLVDPRLSKYLHYSLISPVGGGGELKERAYGIGRPVLSLEDVKNIKIPLAPFDEQKEIINKIEQLLEKEDNSILLINLEKELNQMKNSILSKAFRGELSTNDPKEESAIELLKEVLQNK